MSGPVSIKHAMMPHPVSLAPTIKAQEALEMMRVYGLRHFPVTADGQLLGVVSERDLLRAVGPARPDAEIQEVMTKSVYRVKRDEPLSRVVTELYERKIGCAVIEDQSEKVIGVFTVTDGMALLARLLEEKDSNIREFTVYDGISDRMKLAMQG